MFLKKKERSKEMFKPFTRKGNAQQQNTKTWLEALWLAVYMAFFEN